MAPTIASKQSLCILSTDRSKFLCEEPKYKYFLKFNLFAISTQVFLFTRLANFLSIIPFFFVWIFI